MNLSSPKLKVCSLFSGIGGFELGIQRAIGKENMQVVFASEWDKYAAQIYDKNFSNESSTSRRQKQQKVEQESNMADTSSQCTKQSSFIDTRDIRTVPTEEIPDHDLLVGGFPCQAFSIAGKRKGFDDTRGTLFFEIARILREKKPRLFILENVKGLLSHDNGNTFKTIISTLDELGYDIQWQVLNSKNFGVPQNRERVFIIGNLRGTSRPEIFPVRESDEKYYDENGQGNEIAYCLQAGGDKHRGSYIKQLNNPNHSNNRLYGTEGISPTLNTMSGCNRQPKVVSMIKQIAHKRTNETPIEINKYLRSKRNIPISDLSIKLNLPKTQVEHYFRTDKSRAIPAPETWIKLKEILLLDDRYDKQVTEFYDKEVEFEQNRRVWDITISPTLSCGDKGHFINTSKIRRLTPIECERLQGFPDGHTAGVSDTQRYKMCGNAVTVNVVEYIVKCLS